MVGPIANACTVIGGCIFGSFIGRALSADLRTKMNMVIGCCAMTIGISMVGKLNQLPPVVLATLVGTVVGEILRIEKGAQLLGIKIRAMMNKLGFGGGHAGMTDEEFNTRFVAVAVLLSASGLGIFGSMQEGITGNANMLYAKSILDFFSATIFGATLGMSVAVLSVPQFIIQAGLFLAASLIMPLATPTMLADFSGCGGLITLAIGFRICGLVNFPVASMLAALVLVMPASSLWSSFFG